MFEIEDFKRTLEKFACIVRLHSIRFHLTGGISNTVYAEPRMTQDIDIVVSNQDLADTLSSFLGSLENSDFIHDVDSIRDAVRNKGLFQLLDGEESLKLDVYPRELVSDELTRSENVEIFEGTKYPVVSLPDSVVSKLIWVSKGSHKSRQDLKRGYARCSSEQRELVERLVRELGMMELLKTVLAEDTDFLV